MADAPPDTGARKGPEAFRTISEASAELGVPAHVLRFWETRFSFIRPMKRAGGRRFYRRQDLDVLRGVRALLHDEGYTIKGVQRLHREHGLRRLAEAGAGAGAAGEPSTPPQAPVEPPETPAVEPAQGRLAFQPVAADDTRSRLLAVLQDLEGAKAEIDALLRDDPHS